MAKIKEIVPSDLHLHFRFPFLFHPLFLLFKKKRREKRREKRRGKMEKREKNEGIKKERKRKKMKLCIEEPSIVN
jgi:hypothetical protein